MNKHELLEAIKQREREVDARAGRVQAMRRRSTPQRANVSHRPRRAEAAPVADTTEEDAR